MSVLRIGRGRPWQTQLTMRLLIRFLPLAVFIVLATSLSTLFLVQRSVEQSVGSRLAAVTLVKADELARWMTDRRQRVESLAASSQLRQGVAALAAGEPCPACQEQVAAVQQEISDFLEVLILSNPGGQVLLASDPRSTGRFFVDAAFFREGRQHTYVQPVYLSPTLGTTTVTIATPISGADGVVRGVAVVHLNLSRIDRVLLERTGLGKTGVSFLVDAVNVPVAGHEDLLTRFPRGVHTVGVDMVVSGATGTASYANVDGIPVIGAYHWIDELQLGLVTELAEDEAMAPARQLALASLAIGSIACVALAAGLWLTARQIVRPVQKLTAAVQRVTAGDLDQTVRPETSDEIGQLALGFNHMVKQLGQLVADIERTGAQQLALQQQMAEERQAALQERMTLQQHIIAGQQAALRDLATPLIPISDTAVVMPLVGSIDSSRAQQVLETLLAGIERQQARVAILDLTGVQIVDAEVAGALVRVAQASRLLGARVILTGIRPEVAEALVHLGADLSGITALGSLQEAIGAVIHQRFTGTLPLTLVQ